MRIPLNKSAAQSKIDKLEERLDVIEHGLLFEIEGVLTDRELELWDLQALRSRLATLHQVAKGDVR